MGSFAVGIDLGTTHSAMAVTSLEDEEAAVAVFEVPQLVARGAFEPRLLMPSCIYFAHESEGALALPWDAARRFAYGPAIAVGTMLAAVRF